MWTRPTAENEFRWRCRPVDRAIDTLAIGGPVDGAGRTVRLKLVPLADYAATTGFPTVAFAYSVVPESF